MNNSSLLEAESESKLPLGALAYVEAVTLSLICLVSLIGNVSLFLIVFRNRVLRNRSNLFTLNLACADILVSSINMPITVFTILSGEWLLGHTMCLVFGFVTILSFIASVMSLALIAINRYFYIVHWKNYQRFFRKSRVTLFIACDWILSLLLSSPPALGWSRFDYIPGKSYCFVFWPANVYFMYFMIIVCFFGPLVTMAVCYTKILIFTKNARRKVLVKELPRKTQTRSSWLGRNLSREETKITNTLLIVLAAFLACWAPFAITMFLDVYYPHPLPRAVDMGSLLLGYVNSMCNPLIYAVRNQKFRVGFMKLFSVCLPCLKNRITAAVVARQPSAGESSLLQRPAVIIAAEVQVTHSSHA